MIHLQISRAQVKEITLLNCASFCIWSCLGLIWIDWSDCFTEVAHFEVALSSRPQQLNFIQTQVSEPCCCQILPGARRVLCALQWAYDSAQPSLKMCSRDTGLKYCCWAVQVGNVSILSAVYKDCCKHYRIGLWMWVGRWCLQLRSGICAALRDAGVSKAVAFAVVFGVPQRICRHDFIEFQGSDKSYSRK